MPYTIEKRGSEWCLVRQNGTIKQCHKSKKDAEGARRAIAMSEHGASPANKKGK
jgi:hypothetical protein